MAGIKIQKNYISTNINTNTVANNWMALVFGVTSRGPTKPTLVQDYQTFLDLYGQPVSGAPTHPYMRFVLENGVPILFKRVIDSSKITKASHTYIAADTSTTNICTISANTNYAGKDGNKISIQFSFTSTNYLIFTIKYDSKVVETFNLGYTSEVTFNNDTTKTLMYAFLSKASKQTVSNYVDFKLLINNEDFSKLELDTSAMENSYNLEGGTEPDNTVTSAIDMLKDETSEIYTDTKLLQAITYFPQLRFCTTGGLIAPYSGEIGKPTYDNSAHEKILENLGKFATNCKSTFRVLIDYGVEMTDIETVRNFARTISGKGEVNTSIYAFFGWWGSDSYNNFIPGSAGFLTALISAGYNVYSRRMAGTSFSPAFNKPYEEEYIDVVQNWQLENTIQANPIVIVDAADNLAIMGSSTLAMPLGVLSARNPQQALDIVCVSDYVAAILHGIALNNLEAPLDRLLLSAMSNTIRVELDKFVSSTAITRYDLKFDTTQLGKLGIECILYFAIGLEEVSITVTSVYDTEIFA